MLLFVVGIPVLGGSTVGALWATGMFITRRTAALLAVTVGNVVLMLVLGYKLLDRILKIGRDDQPEYEAEFRRRVAMPLLKEVLPECEPGAGPLIEAAVFDASGLFKPGYAEIVTECGFTGRASETPYRASVMRAGRQVNKAGGAGSSGPRQFWLRHFAGVFVLLERPVQIAATVRLVDPVYQEPADTSGMVRNPNLVRSSSGDASFDSAFWLLLDKGQSAAPPIPEGVKRACAEIRASLGKPVMISFNNTGTYLAVLTGHERLPLSPELPAEGAAELLAEELEWLRRIPAAVETLRRGLA